MRNIKLKIFYSKRFAFAILCVLSSGAGTKARQLQPDVPRLEILDLPPQPLQFEKAYLHFDGNIYMAGDTCWYKAYVVDATDNRPTNKSGVLYIDLIDPTGKVIDHQKLKLINGTSAGQISLSRYLVQGPYTIRGYTSLMRNDDPDFYFYKRITVISPVTDHQNLSYNENDVSNIIFLPEGGNFVTGLENRVAFRATNINGKGIVTQGEVLDEKNNVIMKFQTVHNGLGFFSLIPRAGNRYVAKLSNGKTFNLPTPSDTGVVFSVGNLSDDRIILKVQSKGSVFPRKMKVLATRNSIVHFEGTINLMNSGQQFEIPKAGLPNGLLVLTLFDMSDRPLAERAVFIKSKDSKALDITIEHQYDGKSLILDIDVKDHMGKAVSGDFSLSVSDEQLVPSRPFSENLLTYLKLQSEIRGTIENPGWYFENQNTSFELDLLMLTYGWRRVNWRSVQTPDSPKFKMEKGITLHGVVVKKESLKPIQGANIFLIADGRDYSGLYSATSDADGSFEIRNIDFNDSTFMTWKIQNQKGIPLNASIMVHEDTIPASNIQPQYPTSDYSKETLRYVKDRYKSLGILNLDSVTLLQEVEVQGRKEYTAFKQSSHNKLTIRPGASDYGLSLTQVISRHNPAMQFIGTGAFISLARRGDRGNGPAQQPPLIIIDEVHYIADPNVNPYAPINSVATSEIDRVEILSGAQAAVYGLEARGGVLKIYTKKSADPSKESAARRPESLAANLNYQGYVISREFYQTEDQTSLGNRPTLYWNPHVKVDENGQARIKLNLTSSNIICIKIEGMTNGSIGTTQKVITLE